MSDPGSDVFRRIFDQALPGRRALSGCGECWTYERLRADAEGLAAGLERLGVRPGDRVGVVAANHPASVLIWLACARVGIVACMVNSLLKHDELARLFGSLRPSVVFTDAAHHGQVAVALNSSTGSDVAPVPIFGVTGDAGVPQWSTLVGGLPSSPFPQAQDSLEITFTSGTTSAPKGALFTHAAHLYSVDAWARHVGLRSTDVVFTILPLFHAGGMRNATLGCLFAGGECVIDGPFSASTFWSRVVETGTTFFISVETVVSILLIRDEFPAEHSVRLFAGPAPRDLIGRFEEKLGATSIQNYGLTEVGSVSACTAALSAAELMQRRELRTDAFYVGAPLGADTQIRIVRADGSIAGTGEPGEIHINTPGAFVEYVAAPELTAAAFTDGWFRTGDLGLIVDTGELYFIERLKELIRRGGENLGPREVEDVIAAHPAVSEVAVYGVPDPIRVEEVKALVVMHPDTELDPDALWAWCDQRLADFKVPRYLEFRESLPRNMTGRVLKHELRREPITGHGRTYDRVALTQTPTR